MTGLIHGCLRNIRCGFCSRYWWVCAALVTVACRPPAIMRDLPRVEQATERFHARLAASEDDAIYNDATEHFRGATSRNRARRAFAKFRNAFGKCGAYTRVKANERRNSRGSQFAITYRLRCSSGSVEESFDWIIRDDAVRLDEWGYTAVPSGADGRSASSQPELRQP